MYLHSAIVGNGDDDVSPVQITWHGFAVGDVNQKRAFEKRPLVLFYMVLLGIYSTEGL
jgi:hypothetical protein